LTGHHTVDGDARASQQQAVTAIFGGTFDPIHNAHLAVARAAADRFGLRRILFVPAANPPHKAASAMAPFEDRLRMVELACESDPRFEASRIEEGPGPSYSITTVEKLLEAGAGPLCFLIGADAFADIRLWHRWEDLVRLTEFIVVTRPEASYAVPPGARVQELSGLDLRISSSDVRDHLAESDSSIPLPAAVLAYIRRHDLYRSQTI
jgi:nicotinate-nucleotide adenylyltransferase